MRSSSGSLAMFTAMRHASSRVSSLADSASPGLLLEIGVGQRLPVGVADGAYRVMVDAIDWRSGFILRADVARFVRKTPVQTG